MIRIAKNRGFSLAEVLTVSVILAILFAILLPVFAQARVAGIKSAGSQSLRQVGLACLAYADDYDLVPPHASHARDLAIARTYQSVNESTPAVRLSPQTLDQIVDSYGASRDLFQTDLDPGPDSATLVYPDLARRWTAWNHDTSLARLGRPYTALPETHSISLLAPIQYWPATRWKEPCFFFDGHLAIIDHACAGRFPDNVL